MDDPQPNFSWGVVCIVGGAVAGVAALVTWLLQDGLVALMRRRSRSDVDRLLPVDPGAPS